MTIAKDIAASAPTNPRLKVIHTTGCNAFREICRIGSLSPTACPVMNSNFLYFFYGRPSYRAGNIDVTNRDLSDRPVIFLFDAEAILEPSAIYPFDTGAHANNKYHPHMQGVNLESLNCININLAEQKIVTRYFGSNVNYFYGAAVPVLNPVSDSDVALAFHELITSDDDRLHDDRCLTIEILTPDSVGFDQGLRGIVLPDFLAADREILSWLTLQENNGAKISFYRPQTISNFARTVEQQFPLICELQGINPQ